MDVLRIRTKFNIDIDKKDNISHRHFVIRLQSLLDTFMIYDIK